jgi:hypothetical protein
VVIVIIGSILVQPVILSLLKVITTCMSVSAHWELMVVVGGGGGGKGLHPRGKKEEECDLVWGSIIREVAWGGYCLQWVGEVSEESDAPIHLLTGIAWWRGERHKNMALLSREAEKLKCSNLFNYEEPSRML